MIRTGRVGNVVLGVGDPARFSLLGGSFGQAGDVVSGTGGGQGARFFKNGKAVILAAAARASGGAGGDVYSGQRPNQGGGGTGTARPRER